MTINERNILFAKFFNDECLGTMTAKGGDYAGDSDANQNFKRIATILGLSKYQVWSVYFNKHVDAVNNSIKRNPERPVRKAEGIKESLKDIINYAGILLSMLEEDAESIKNLELGIKNEESGIGNEEFGMRNAECEKNEEKKFGIGEEQSAIGSGNWEVGNGEEKKNTPQSPLTRGEENKLPSTSPRKYDTGQVIEWKAKAATLYNEWNANARTLRINGTEKEIHPFIEKRVDPELIKQDEHVCKKLEADCCQGEGSQL
jgi:hypothetical protein